MLEKTYDPQSIEARWYAHWETGGAFAAGRKAGGEPYVIMIPPPNVTGSLHMGHALNNTLQDVLVRYHRMKGYDVLWQPGTDHAGIATQMVVERNLDAEGLKRQDLGRAAFLERVWAWKAESGGTITRQLRRLGASCDWTRERFTMDEDYSRAVVQVFVELYRRKLLYRDKRLVNWDPKLKTSISDLEVEQREVQGQFAHLRYPLADDPARFIVVATTRPETMLGDTGVAVHPDDARYTDVVGRMIRHPLTGRLIPVVADEWADPELGSGAVKITPAHDFNDFAVGQRHDLPRINIMTDDARMNDSVPEKYRGMDRYEARKAVLADLDTLGLLERVEDKIIQMPYGDRSGVVVEPYLTDQWYVDAGKLAVEAIAAVEKGRTTFVPANWDKTYYEWMRNIQPWCVSRQLWWGHQIPAWYDTQGNVFVAADEAGARAQAGDDRPLNRDEDVLDTWFSSALWPFATQGWPAQTPALKAYYPGSVLVTGFDIIFFWVARMMMQGIEFMGDAPFHTVYITGLVRDEKGQKMSKSKGNVKDPLDFIDKYGADALRFFMASMETQGRDIKLNEKRVEGYRNFGTKLWNAARFCEMNGIGGSRTLEPPPRAHVLNRWIVSETAAMVTEIDKALAGYRFDEAASAIYRFIWDRFCDWYLELSKPILQTEGDPAQDETRAVASWVFDQILVCLHPFMPFITEELWHAMGDRPHYDLITARWPQVDPLWRDAEASTEINWLVDLISQIRSARTELNVPPSAQVPLHVATESATRWAAVERHAAMIRRLARLSDIAALNQPDLKGQISIAMDDAVYRLPVAGIIDVAAELARLRKALDKLEKEIAGISGRLSNPAFVSKAPPEVIEENREKLGEVQAQQTRLREALARLAA